MTSYKHSDASHKTFYILSLGHIFSDTPWIMRCSGSFDIRHHGPGQPTKALSCVLVAFSVASQTPSGLSCNSRLFKDLEWPSCKTSAANPLSAHSNSSSLLFLHQLWVLCIFLIVCVFQPSSQITISSCIIGVLLSWRWWSCLGGVMSWQCLVEISSWSKLLSFSR